MGVFLGGFSGVRAWVLAAGLVGALALAGCTSAPLRASPNPITPSTVASTAEPTSSAAPQSPFADGSPFDETCAIAWPTAPVVSAASIQLTLTCANVPSSMYVFVVAIYADPKLPVTRTTTTVHILGSIAETAMTKTGLSYLIVTATRITL